jgi:cytochrome b-561 domain containing protein 2
VIVSWIAILTNAPVSKGWFALHPLLQSVALLLFSYGMQAIHWNMFHADRHSGILTLQPTSQPKTKAAGLARHQTAILYLAIPFISFGTFSVWYNKYSNGKSHLVTWHGVRLHEFSRLTAANLTVRSLGPFVCYGLFSRLYWEGLASGGVVLS